MIRRLICGAALVGLTACAAPAAHPAAEEWLDRFPEYGETQMTAPVAWNGSGERQSVLTDRNVELEFWIEADSVLQVWVVPPTGGRRAIWPPTDG